jgi:hypothetical protein
MANQTIQEKITELEAELVLIKSQMATASASSGVQSFTVDGMSVANTSPTMYTALKDRRREIEKSLQRLYRGGRGFVVDMSYPGTDDASTDNTVYTEVQA